jgi:phage shock protein PspC (stress-responsive transcriptional regulator)
MVCWCSRRCVGLGVLGGVSRKYSIVSARVRILGVVLLSGGI